MEVSLPILLSALLRVSTLATQPNEHCLLLGTSRLLSKALVDESR